MAVLGSSVDELDGDLLLGLGHEGLGNDGLAKGDGPLLSTSDGTLDHDPVFADHTVVGEATKRGDALLGKILLGGGGGINLAFLGLLADAVDHLVPLGTVVVTALTGTGDLVADTGRVPSTDTGDLTETAVGLAGKTGDTPTGNHTLVAVALGDTDGVHELALSEHVVDVEVLLEHRLGEVDLLLDVVAAVDLDFENVSLLLAKVEELDVGVSDYTDDLAVLLDTSQLLLVALIAAVHLLEVLGESLLLGSAPVLVEAALAAGGQVLSPHGDQGTETAGSLDVANHTDDGHGRGLEDGDSLQGLLLVQLCNQSTTHA